MPSFTGLRYGYHDNGKRYVARDRNGHPEHAIWHKGHVCWVAHAEGAVIDPFEAPDDVYAEITKGGSETWHD